ncbi:MAG: cation transporter [Candidatus Omnitrophica bacterium]|nr:cation transporter [Candidatus Omnitrophota bacterium]
MKKFKLDIAKENKERFAYALLYFFMLDFIVKTVFGVMSASKSLLVAGIFALFGILIAVATLMRIAVAHPSVRPGRREMLFTQGKLEYMVLFGVSAIIALATGEMIFSTGHMVFFHTLYPPELLGAWIALGTAVVSLVFMGIVGNKVAAVRETDAHDIMFILETNFILSVVTAVVVVVARMGAYILDYACAIFAAVFIVAYSVWFLYRAFNGLMDASCDKEIISTVERHVRQAGRGAELEALRVNKVGHVYEIVLILTVIKDMPVSEAKKIIARIKEALRIKFLKPHEIFVGMKPMVEQ